MADARAQWMGDAGNAGERKRREESSFLSARDDAGRVVDFHALRHTCGTWLAAAGVHPKVAQSIMRHSSIELTMSRYTHTLQGQEANAVEALPDLSPTGERTEKATGTDGRVIGVADPKENLAENLALKGGFEEIRGGAGRRSGENRREGAKPVIAGAFDSNHLCSKDERTRRRSGGIGRRDGFKIRCPFRA